MGIVVVPELEAAIPGSGHPGTSRAVSARPGFPLRGNGEQEQPSVPVVLRLVRPFERHAEVIGLFLRQRRQLHADLLQVQARDFLVELLGQAIDRLLVRVLVRPQVDLRQRLVGEASSTSRSSDGRSRSRG